LNLDEIQKYLSLKVLYECVLHLLPLMLLNFFFLTFQYGNPQLYLTFTDEVPRALKVDLESQESDNFVFDLTGEKTTKKQIDCCLQCMFKTTFSPY
jgi:hypothetical protein